jgi:acyl-CoA synthetase (AMP-forming)/AMP-acid ligase II
LFKAQELAWLLRFADIDTLLVQAEFAGQDYLHLLEHAIPELPDSPSASLALRSHPFLRRVFVWSPSKVLPVWARSGPKDLLVRGSTQRSVDLELVEAAESSVSPADLLIGICTSGTTAEPKVVLHSHGSVLRTTFSQRRFRSVTETTRDFAGMPLFWVGGLNGHLFPCLYEGARLVFSASPTVADIVMAIQRERVTRLHMIAARRTAVVEEAAVQGVSLSNVEGVVEPHYADGSLIPAPLRGGNLLGMTETFGPHGVEAAGSILPESKARSVGHSMAGIERRVVDPESGAVLLAGEVGELEVRGFSLMNGYYKQERGDVFTDDGWFRTGDLCHLDPDGYLYFDDRMSDMIKTMGANVAPREVEVFLESLPDVAEAVVFGIPDSRRGESVVAVVIAKPTAALDPTDLRSHLLKEISSYKVPTKILVASHEEVPRTNGGKPNRKALRDRLLSD